MTKLYGAEQVGNMIVPSNVELATQPEVQKLRDHSSRSMRSREPLRSERDQLGVSWDIMATVSTDEADPAATEVAAIARDEKGTYGLRYTDGTIIPLDPFGNKHTVVEGDTFVFGTRYDTQRDELTMFGEEGIPGKNGYDLIETMAMFPPEAPEAPAQ